MRECQQSDGAAPLSALPFRASGMGLVSTGLYAEL